ncbi:MAG: hypothetical protein ACM3U2_10215 [Deltaproteobacteria bacterium]
MAEQLQLPDLPLMLASVPRQVASLLREAGIPAESLPEIPLLAAGTGRFVLFDAHSAHSAARARRAAACGLKPIDIREFLPKPDDGASPALEEATAWRPTVDSAARIFLERLKAAVETLGGVWMRLADYPFPYQSALCLGVEHLSEELAGFADIAAALPGKATHFVSSRLRADRLAFLAQGASSDLGWQIRPDDFERSPRRTLSHWITRMERFAAAGLRPAGVALADEESPLPAVCRLLRLGLRYSCLKTPGPACRAEFPPRAADDPPWIRFSTLALPPREWFVELVGEHYQSGCPLFLSAATEGLDLVQELLRLAGDAGRCSLMWQTSYGEFARWWALRRRLRLQVWRTGMGHEIHAAGDFGRFAWGVEIWRGNHVATLPLRNAELFVPDDGLVYLQSPRKNPAGCTTPGDGVRSLIAPQQETRVRDLFLTRSRFRRKGSPE